MGDEHNTRLMRTPKEGERILAPTRRPDGTLRKPIRIRAGYTPQDEVAIYKSKGTLMRKSAEVVVPPGYEPSMDAKLKTKSAKRNERKKEKKLQFRPNETVKITLKDSSPLFSVFNSKKLAKLWKMLIMDSVAAMMSDLGRSFSSHDQRATSQKVKRKIRGYRKLINLVHAKFQEKRKTHHTKRELGGVNAKLESCKAKLLSLADHSSRELIELYDRVMLSRLKLLA
ncbi:hypothetical protein KSP39_PZI003393 [Platanthera zijinensis]|uniref:WIBG Mago-binding domain-containing protein n=1 Tax=Platanthera zijinensis TaxID=2320716 RepID=A0AAP0BYF4_9ASPA